MRRLGKIVVMTEKEHTLLVNERDAARDYLHIAEAARDDAWEHADDFAAGLNRMQANRRAERKRAFLAGKFHAAGGYAHALKETRLKLQGTTAVMCRFMDLAAKWRPLVECLESYPNQFVEIGFDAGLHFPVKRWNKDGTEYLASVRYQDKEYPDHSHDLMRKFGDMSDPAAPADFAAVGGQVKEERAWKKPDMTREEFEFMRQGHWDAAEKVTV